MNKKLIAFGITALTASILSAAPAVKSIATHNFEGKAPGLNPYPPAAKAYLSMEANAEKNSKVLKVVVPADKKYTTFYQSMILKTPGPGKIVMTLDYKIAKAVEGIAELSGGVNESRVLGNEIQLARIGLRIKVTGHNERQVVAGYVLYKLHNSKRARHFSYVVGMNVICVKGVCHILVRELYSRVDSRAS